MFAARGVSHTAPRTLSRLGGVGAHEAGGRDEEHQDGGLDTLRSGVSVSAGSPIASSHGEYHLVADALVM
ncbi:hypothetical protein A0H81_10256 [Grifola frondosa]|uniref:Uncharacterized protein n=1 Tax=Grifola frondosa TaxID=5627 RepID=A0A1C7LZH7_GRIFR|nr:hypothetical protein A0H81_10256 [Grifola frondosa]